MALSREQLQARAGGKVGSGWWPAYENGRFVDYVAPMIDDVYVSDPETGRHLFTDAAEATAAAQRFQDKVRQHLATAADRRKPA